MGGGWRWNAVSGGIHPADGTLSPQTFIFPWLSETDRIPILHFVDLNFDGHLDVQAYRVGGAICLYSTCFINNGQDSGFTEEPKLSNLSKYLLFPKQRLILNHERDSSLTAICTLYHWNSAFDEVQFSRFASLLYDERDVTGQSLFRKETDQRIWWHRIFAWCAATLLLVNNCLCSPLVYRGNVLFRLHKQSHLNHNLRFPFWVAC